MSKWKLPEGQFIETRHYKTKLYNGNEGLEWWFCAVLTAIILFACGVLLFSCETKPVYAGEVWKVTSYCACKKCCGPNAQGITASGKKVAEGMVACNWLPFGTKVKVEGLGVFTVQDRGAKSQFGSKTNHIKHIDVYLPSHQKALQFGVKYLEVEIL